MGRGGAMGTGSGLALRVRPLPACLWSCSENFLVRWDSMGMPKEIEKLNNLPALFTVTGGGVGGGALPEGAGFNLLLLLVCPGPEQQRLDEATPLPGVPDHQGGQHGAQRGQEANWRTAETLWRGR